MPGNDAASQSSLLKEMIRVKKLHSKAHEARRHRPKITYDLLQRRSNYEEFKTVYEGALKKRHSGSSVNENDHGVHKTKSGSFYRYPKVRKEPQYVETINVELPLHYGADRAVQLIENKIKPKKSTPIVKVSREVSTNQDHPIKSSIRSRKSLNKPKKSVTIVDALATIEEASKLEQESITDVTKKQIKEIETHLKSRREKIHKTLPKPMAIKGKPLNSKIMCALSKINENLRKMQEKYFESHKVRYRSVNDCFTQSGNLEVLFENEKYPVDTEKNIGDSLIRQDSKNSNILMDPRMQERIKEMKASFPEFPQIEDTLREIENHLEKIVNLKVQSDHKTTGIEDDVVNMLDGKNFAELLNQIDREKYHDYVAQEIINQRNEAKHEKLRSIRQQIDEVEGFCDRLSEIANCDDNIETANEQQPQAYPPESYYEGYDLQSCIKKSNYLSREFDDLQRYSACSPMVKIFSENQRNFWKERRKEADKHNEEYSVESVTKMIDSLKCTLENSIYEPVPQ